MPSLLVGSQMSREVTSEQSSARDGVGYDEVFQSGHKPEEGFSWLSKRETLAQPCDEELESYREGDKGIMSNEEGKGVMSNEEGEEEKRENDDDNDGDEDNSDEEVLDSTSGAPRDDRPFILPKIWTVNDFLLMMSDKVFKTLRDRYQIPENIPIRLPRKFEKCYLGKTADVGMYDAMFAVRLRLPLTMLHRQLANFLGFSVSQIASNAWRTFIGAEVLWGCLSGGNRQLTIDEFFWCYRPQHIVSSQGIYHFVARKKGLKLVFDMLDSNRN